MTLLDDPRIARPITLIRAAIRPPRGVGRIALALCIGVLCHATFAAGVLAMIVMIVMMFFGLSKSLGTVPWPMAALANAALISQFPLAHSLLLTGPGGRFLDRIIPGPSGQTLAARTMLSLHQSSFLCSLRYGRRQASSGGEQKVQYSGL